MVAVQSGVDFFAVGEHNPAFATVRVLLGSKLQVPHVPRLRASFPCRCRPTTSQASSMMGYRTFFRFGKPVHVPAAPNIWTGMIARVLSVISLSVETGSRLRVPSISPSTGTAFAGNDSLDQWR